MKNIFKILRHFKNIRKYQYQLKYKKNFKKKGCQYNPSPTKKTTTTQVPNP